MVYLALVLLATIWVTGNQAQNVDVVSSLLGIEPVAVQPAAPKSLSPIIYPASGRLRLMMNQQRQRQLQQQPPTPSPLSAAAALWERVKKELTPQRLQDLTRQLTSDQMLRLVTRIRQIKALANQTTSAVPTGIRTGSASPRDMNTVLSGAGTVRRVGVPNSVQISKNPGFPTNVRQAPRNSITSSIRAYQKFAKKSKDAVGAGCTYPMGMEGMESALMFSTCADPMVMSSCIERGRSCVQMGMSVMCCPFGMNSQTIDAMGMMNQMQQLMAQFS